MNNFEETVRGFEEDLVDKYADPGDLVRRSLSAEFAASMGQQPHEVLVSCAMALTRFALYIQTRGNKARAEVTHLRRTLEYKTAQTIGSLKGFTTRDTNTARVAAAYKANTELPVLEEKLATAEQCSIYYDRIPDVLLELVNVMKYEIRRREKEMEVKV